MGSAIVQIREVFVVLPWTLREIGTGFYRYSDGGCYAVNDDNVDFNDIDSDGEEGDGIAMMMVMALM